MEGYEVQTSDDHRLGHVVRRAGESLIVEHDILRKTCHALPLAFAEVDDDARVVRTTLSKQMIEDSPKVKEGDVDERAVALYYGLAEGEEAPPTQGYGELIAEDPARTAEEQGERAGVTPAPEERAQIRESLSGEHTYGPPGRPIIPPDPHEVGGRPVDPGQR